MRKQTKQNRRKLARRTRRLRGGVNVKAIAAAFEKKALNASLKNGFRMRKHNESIGGECGKCGEICYPLTTVLRCTCENEEAKCPT